MSLQDHDLYWWAWNWRYRILHPRDALCDAGVWKCSRHDRMLWLASERRWAWRHKLRARRVRRYTGWQPGELRALMGPTRAERRREAELHQRLAFAFHRAEEGAAADRRPGARLEHAARAGGGAGLTRHRPACASAPGTGVAGVPANKLDQLIQVRLLGHPRTTTTTTTREEPPCPTS
jgi:hypothetical protein